MDTQTFKVRDVRKRDWFSADNLFLDVYAKHFGAIGSSVYFTLCRRADGEQKCFPSQKNIAEMLGVSDRTVRKYLSYLEKARFVFVEKKYRNKSGIWLHNVYWLLDKSEWLTPEEMVSSGIQRNEDAPLEEDNGISQRNEFPTNNTNINNTNFKNTNAVSDSDNLIDEIINSFQSINPNYKRLRTNLTQRKATGRLLKTIGKVELDILIKKLPLIAHKDYCPKAVTPYDLDKNLPQLLVFIKRHGDVIDKAKIANKYAGIKSQKIIL